MALKLPLFEKFCPLSVKERAEGLHWLELIAEILSFLQIFSVRKTTTPFF